MKTNYHGHTYRCNHAVGTDEEYVLKAIEKGVEIYAFTDHMPCDITGTSYRMKEKDLESYLDSVYELKEKYKDKIQILAGLECEYFENLIPLYESFLANPRIELLIFGNHFEDETLDRYYFNSETEDDIESYCQNLEKGIESGFYDLVAHPDLYGAVFPWNEKCDELAHRICKKALEHDIPLGFNTEGMRAKHGSNKANEYYYPIEQFWKISAEYQNKVIINGDYHNPETIEDENVQLARIKARELGLNVIEVLELKRDKKIAE